MEPTSGITSASPSGTRVARAPDTLHHHIMRTLITTRTDWGVCCSSRSRSHDLPFNSNTPGIPTSVAIEGLFAWMASATATGSPMPSSMCASGRRRSDRAQASCVWPRPGARALPSTLSEPGMMPCFGRVQRCARERACERGRVRFSFRAASRNGSRLDVNSGEGLFPFASHVPAPVP